MDLFSPPLSHTAGVVAGEQPNSAPASTARLRFKALPRVLKRDNVEDAEISIGDNNAQELSLLRSADLQEMGLPTRGSSPRPTVAAISPDGARKGGGRR